MAGKKGPGNVKKKREEIWRSPIKIGTSEFHFGTLSRPGVEGTGKGEKPLRGDRRHAKSTGLQISIEKIRCGAHDVKRAGRRKEPVHKNLVGTRFQGYQKGGKVT